MEESTLDPDIEAVYARDSDLAPGEVLAEPPSEVTETPAASTDASTTDSAAPADTSAADLAATSDPATSVDLADSSTIADAAGQASGLGTVTTVLVGIAVVIVLWLIFTYNGLVRLRMRVKEAWSDIDVQLKRRYNLIPNLVETVKGYMTHEREVLENVTKARTAAIDNHGSPEEQGKSENMLSGALKTLFAVAENYPDLKANQNFLELQRDLTDTEDKIQAARRFYNGNVRDYNTKIQLFPNNLVAGPLGFKIETFFELDNEKERENVNVKF